MKNQIIKLAGLAIACALVSACDTDFDNPVSGNSGNSGDADLSKFVTIGDSLTAGYADAALYLAGQESSYPAILAQQFAKVGGDSNFTQPLVDDNLGGLLFSTNQILDNRLVLDAETSSPEPIVGTPTTEILSNPGNIFYSNVGVPGAKSFHLGVDGYGDPAGILSGAANPYFARFASDPANISMITDAVSQMPSFYVMWIGNNDVLSYATTGGVGDDHNLVVNLDPNTYGPNDITNTDVFAGVYVGLVDAFKTVNSNVQGVLVNIPDVATIPYFTAVPYNAVPLDQATADILNAAYADYNVGVAAALAGDPDEVAKRTISFTEGQNAVVILDEDLTVIAGLPSMRQAAAEDLLILTASTEIQLGGGTAYPLDDGFVLIPSEIAAIDVARTAFNATIQAIADGDANLIWVDSAAVMQEIGATGIDYGTGAIHADYATGGAFSLDGVHPTARGYAVMANAIIEAINDGFNANIPGVDPGTYTTIFIK